MYFYQRIGWMSLLLLGSFGVNAQLPVLTLEKAISEAVTTDPWQANNRFNQRAIEAKSIAAGTMVDPKVSVGLNNLGLDHLDFNQQDMTQLKIGVSQQLPRGDSRSIAKKQLHLQSLQYPMQRLNRKGLVSVATAKYWLNVYKAQQSIALIERNRALFEQLADVAQSSYSNALGKTRQQDIVRAELELTRLNNRLLGLKQKQLMSWHELGQWLDVNAYSRPTDKMQPLELKTHLMPDFNHHPAFKALLQKTKAQQQGILLAKQQYKPQWSVNAGYGYRGENTLGQGRSDLFSVGVSLDIPLFTDKRQDKQLEAAQAQYEAVKTEKLLLLRQFRSRFHTAMALFSQLTERQSLYEDKLLPQLNEQAEAALTAYTNDDGDFAEVVRARIDQLNAQIELLDIAVERQKTIAKLNYFYLTGNNKGSL